MQGYVFGVEMFEELIAEDDIYGCVGNRVELVAIVDNQFKIIRKSFIGIALVGNIDANDMGAMFAGLKSKAAIAGGDFQESHLWFEMRGDETELFFDIASALLGGFAAGEPRMVGYAFE